MSLKIHIILEEWPFPSPPIISMLTKRMHDRPRCKCASACVCVRACLCLRVCACVCVCLCVCVCMFIDMFLSLFLSLSLCVCAITVLSSPFKVPVWLVRHFLFIYLWKVCVSLPVFVRRTH